MPVPCGENAPVGAADCERDGNSFIAVSIISAESGACTAFDMRYPPSRGRAFFADEQTENICICTESPDQPAAAVQRSIPTPVGLTADDAAAPEVTSKRE